MTTEAKITHQRLSPLELGQALTRVSQACRQSGVPRSQF